MKWWVVLFGALALGGATVILVREAIAYDGLSLLTLMFTVAAVVLGLRLERRP